MRRGAASHDSAIAEWDQTTSILGAVEEQAAATREVSENINGVTQATLETERSSGEVTAAAADFTSQASGLKTRMEAFMAGA